ncbi:TetR/AcrR family transcriptional regulator [Cellulosimicrobium protaetiae]|uniref:TetR/AcrR family transcriptional regulator n=1 Tax=Cellulosimicrobium protaetiae TaxID=2587808 RepID=A0A6M5UCX1_9MICO|nr:TetR/AcrR family transcriptional regulator [Cellulosimicrobium protaetiae]QJW36366.1 TetR/AcrR family transcriptional regulator [Cellulosimicrobium protaetiae]
MSATTSSRESAVRALAEVFREHGFDGASMALLTEASGLGKGSLYHFFPGGKREMAQAVLDDVDAWFRGNLFAPLQEAATPESARAAVESMFDAVEVYFRSGRRACLPGSFALSRPRDLFTVAINDYFTEWIDALGSALEVAGIEGARSEAIRVVADIQGAIVLAHALDDSETFTTVLEASRGVLDPRPGS